MLDALSDGSKPRPTEDASVQSEVLKEHGVLARAEQLDAIIRELLELPPSSI
jgi:hypothetical protein